MSGASVNGTHVVSPLQGTIVSLLVAPGDDIATGALVALVESMKMHHEVRADAAGVVTAVLTAVGATVASGDAVIVVDPLAVDAHGPSTPSGRAVSTGGGSGSGETSSSVAEVPTVDPSLRADLAETIERHRTGLDAARPDAVASRRKRGRRTARENIADLCDDGSFVEYGALAIAAQRRRRSIDDLIANTPADGLVGGIGTVNGDLFDGHARQVAVASYDYTVLAGTQGTINHRKKDRLFELAAELRLPFVLFTEGGGGRPGDTETPGPTGLDCLAFGLFAELSGLVPLVGVNAGYCFAGNAALLGCCDVVIATEDSNIGMGGPAMIEGGGLGVYPPTAVGPIGVQRANGVVDIVAADETDAVRLAKQYLSYFQGRTSSWTAADQTLLRDVVPADRLRVYDIRRALDLLFDGGSVLELRRDFGVGIVTALARIEGRPVGVLANNPMHLGGAIDTPGSDKAARFMQLCDAFDLPLVTLCDTPGMMVGPDVEETALVRHCNRLFVTGANMTVPRVTVVLRKAYGLGAMAMMGGSTKAPIACLGWPTSEFGGMGLEGAVRLGYRRELDAAPDGGSREELFQSLVAKHYEVGKGISVASYFEIDDVIDPADTRRHLAALLDAAPPPTSRSGKKRPNVDTW
ncbi:carboxyl transferase domain-containing protein [Desertimonas flava]|uniref:carboxyl transferase domain-containing protein n=1 Tax=Desertimonas flava TaxID=2064846 RepID=UPI000E355393|nr:carboxyl transferase domain-containing protein [Desertimonas flava]